MDYDDRSGVWRLLTALVGAIFFAELSVMLVLDRLAIDDMVLEGVIDSTFLVVALFPVLYFLVFRNILDKNAALLATQRELRASNDQLEQRVKERTSELEAAKHALERNVAGLHTRQREMAILGEMGRLFQACRDINEAYSVGKTQISHLFPGISGALYLMNASRNVLEKTMSWNDDGKLRESFSPDECWALRCGRPHEAHAIDRGLACPHVDLGDTGWHVCLPVTAQSETLGILCLMAPLDVLNTKEDTEDATRDWMQLYGMVTENLALAISNLRLRDLLRYQALRDPLTKLFNRRALLDILEREISRADRGNRPLSFVMLDVDHFKQFNDLFGHDAGDAVLTALGELLLEQIRHGDIACRYGGEEFAIILPESSAATVWDRIEGWRRQIESLDIRHQNQSLGPVTVSAGIAEYPLHATDMAGLIHAADEALYRSKQAGRNRLTLATPLATIAPRAPAEPAAPPESAAAKAVRTGKS